ncbi:MAG TPA: phenylalanine--tRNA ligase subunit beta [Syntrophomonadaceae bacterium]|nr:phenylalanine--tRNA ligase subunit beta [Syntrophomonadaceae bacterium]HPR94099.1 phenylalanine--tRNA ligase subunit beta [Syntrophomonadaceae bacterium]
MGVSINQLKKYIQIDQTAEQLAHNLTMAGIAIEGIETTDDDDKLLELDLTPNRADCLGWINLAREIAALSGADLTIPDVFMKENEEAIEDYITVRIDNPQLCKRYAARVIKNVKIMASPQWMQDALQKAGIRPINNVVDVTNYVMLETNQPLHAFDYDLLGGLRQILVRPAYAQEQFTTLDGANRQLDEEMLVITNGEKPIALAGVMGGENTEINEQTTMVLLESANFLATNIRKTSRKLGLRSDSSIRFEKGVDPNGAIYAANRATQLIHELAGGEVVKGIFDVYPEPIQPLNILLRPERVNYLLGTDINDTEIRSCLNKLRFTVTETGEDLMVQVPTYRPDITLEVDLIEEVARLHGYDKIPATLSYGAVQPGGLNYEQHFRDRIQDILAKNLLEVINYSFINPVAYDLIRLSEQDELRNCIKIANPLSEEQSVMRTLLLPGLLKNIKDNLSRKNENLAFFELGTVFYPTNKPLPREIYKVGAVVAGNFDTNWLKNEVPMDYFYLKGLAEDLLSGLGIEEVTFAVTENPAFHPGRTAVVRAGDKEIGIIGEVHPEVCDNYNIKIKVAALEFNAAVLYELSKPIRMTKEITRYPGIKRDIAVVLPETVTYLETKSIINDDQSGLLQEADIFDIYTGDQVPAGYKSMAFRLLFKSSEKTLTENDVTPIVEDILQRLKSQWGALLR